MQGIQMDFVFIKTSKSIPYGIKTEMKPKKIL